MKRILFLLVFVLVASVGYASHIVGADFFYRYVGYISATNSQRYEVTLKLYRSTSAGSTALAASYQMAVWRNSNAAPATFTRYPNTTTCWTLDSINNRSKIIAPTCISSGVSIQEGTYKMSSGGNPAYLDIPNDTLDYYVGWALSARVNTILNIATPANTGLSCFSKIPKNNVYRNSNPVYLNSPVSFFCQGRTSSFNQNAFDPDGDSLSFAIVQPYGVANGNTGCAAAFPAPTPPAFVYTSNPSPNPNGYSFPNTPLGTASAVSINSVTGEISVFPASIGVYILAVVVKEYRLVSGVYKFLCETRRDIQIQTGTCSATNAAPVFVRVIPIKNADTTANQVVTAGDTLCFNIRFKDPNSGDSLYTSYTGPIFDASGGIAAPYATLTQDTAKDSVTSSFCWFTQCPHARAGSPYIFTMDVRDNQCNEANKTFTILVNPKAVLPPPNLRCVDILNNDSIRLTFSKPNNLKDYDKYYIYRRTGANGSCVLVDSITDSTIFSYIDKNATNAFTQSYGYTLRTRSTCSVYGPGCDTVNSIIVAGSKPSDHCTSLTWTRHRQNTSALYNVYRTIGAVKTLVTSTRNAFYTKCDCNTAGKFSVEVEDSLISCISHSNITGVFSNVDTTAPKVVAITRVTVNTTTQIQIDFPKSDSADVTRYIIYRSNSPTGSTVYDSINAVPLQANYSYLDNSSINSGPYYYRIQTRDSCGNRSSLSVSHSAVDLTGTGGNATSKLNWVKKYYGFSFANQVIQKRTSATSWIDYKTLNNIDTFYNDTNVISCGIYFYRLRTKNSSDTTIISYSDSVRVQPFDTVKPLAPVVLYSSVTGASSVTLVFDTSVSMDTKTYLIFGAVNGGAYVAIDSLVYPLSRPISYTWTGINPQLNTYRMYVAARDSCGNNLSAPSLKHSHVQLNGTPGNYRNALIWTNYIGRTPATYVVQRYEVGSGFGWSSIKTLNYPDTAFTDSTSLKGCYTYVYRVITSFPSSIYTSISDTISLIPLDLLPPGPPTINYVSVVNNTTNKVVITKSDSLDVNRYQIFFKSSISAYRSAGIVFYPTTNPFVFTHTGVYTPDSNYTYYVKAIDSCGSNSSAASPTHTTIQLRSTPGAMTNFLTWTKYQGWSSVSSYNVLRYIGSTWTLVKTVSSVDSSWADTTNLKCNQSNGYRVYALNALNDTSYSDTTMVAPYDTIRPAVPFLRSVSVINNTSVTIAFNTVVTPDVNRYQIWSATNNGAFSLVTTILYPSTNPVTYTHTGLNTLSNTYRYYVVSIDSCSSNVSLPSIAHRTINLRSTPGAMTNFVYWNRYEGWSSVSSYNVLRYIGSTWTLVKTLAGTDTAWADTTNLKCNQSNGYRVYALNALNDTSYSDTTMVAPYDTIRPAVPFLRSVSVINNTSVTIAFNTVVTPDVNRYQIWSATNNGAFSLVTTILYPSTNPVTYTHTGLNTLSNTYRYYVVSIDSCSSNVSLPSIAHRTINLRSTPGAMTNFVYWNRYEGWSSVSSYNVLCYIGSTWTLVKTLTGTDTAWADTTNLKCNQSNGYRVYALNALNDTSYSDTTMVAPYDTIRPAVPFLRSVSVINNTSVTIAFNTVVTPDVNRYQIWSATNNGAFSLVTTILYPSTNPVTYTHTGLNTLSNTYRYYAVSIDSCSSNVSLPSIAHRTINLQSTPGAMTNFMYWNRYEGWSSVSSYNVLRYIGSTWTLVKTLTGADTAWADTTNLKCNQSNSYRIFALNALSDTSYSDTTIVTPYDTIRPAAPLLRYVTVLNNTSVNIAFNRVADQDVNRYQLWAATNNGAFSLLTTIFYPTTNPVVFTHSGLNTLSNNYRYYVLAIDSCSNNVSQVSTIHKTINLQSTIGAMTNFLRWNPYQGWTPTSYNVLRYIGSTWTLVKTLTGADTAWADTTNLKCNQSNSYRIFALNALSDTSYSDTTIVTPYDTIRPAAPLLRYVTVLNNTSVNIAFNRVADQDVNRYQLWAATNNGAFSLLTTIFYPTTNPVVFTHSGLNTLSNNYRYYILAFDSCSSNISQASAIHKTINLQSTIGAMTNFLRWNPYQGWTPTSYNVLRYIGSTWTLVKTLAGTDTAWADTTNLKCNQSNTYKVYALNALSDTSYSDTTIVTPYDTIRPAAPLLRYVTVLNNTSVNIAFNRVADQDVNRYQLWSATNNGAFSLLTTIFYPTTNPVVFTHSGLNTLSNNYRYYILAIDSCSNNISQASAIHKTINLQSTIGAMTNFLRWNPYQGWTPTSYNVLRYIGSTWTLVKTLTSADSTWADTTNLQCNQSNTYKVYALNALSDTSYSDTTIVTPYDTIRPAAPLLRYVTVLNNTSVNIAFNRVADQDVNRYQIWAATNNGAFSLLTTIFYPTTNPVVFTHSGLNTLSNNYRYYILAFDSCSNNVSQASVIHKDIQLSSSPGNLTSKLTWTAYQGFAVGEYRVLRLIGGVWTFMKSLPATDSSYNDTTNIGCNYNYAYKVLGINTSTLDTSYSDTTMVTPFDTIKPDLPVIKAVTVSSNSSVTITWQPSNADVNKILIYRRNSFGVYVLIDSVYYATSYTDYTALPNIGSEYYRIQAVDSCAENKSLLSVAHRSIKLNSTYQKCPKGIILNWNDYQTWSSGIVNYRLYRSDSINAEALIATLSGSTFTYTDTLVKYNTLYHYRIKAIQNLGIEVSWSDSSNLLTPYGDGAYINYVSVLTTSTTTGSIKIEWDALRFNPFALRSVLYYSPTGLPGTFSILLNNIPLSVNSFTQTNINTKTKSHYYYMISVDSCNRVTDSMGLHRSINFHLTGGQLTNLMHWSAYTGWAPRYYILERANKLNPVFADLDTIPATDTSFVDFPAPCNIDLLYRIKAVSWFGFMSYSDTAITVAIDTLPPDRPHITNATVWANGVNRIDFVTADSADIFGYALYRKQNNSSWFNVKFTQYAVRSVAYTIYDSTANTLLDYNQYVLITLDSCLNATPSDTFNIIQLRGNAGERRNVLAWHRFKGYAVDTFELQKWNGIAWVNFKRIVNDTNYLDTALLCNSSHYYRVWSRENNGTRITISDSIFLIPFDSIRPQPVIMYYARVLNNSQIGLQWRLTDVDAKDYIVQQKINNGIYQTIDTLHNYPTTYTSTVGSTLQDTFSYRIIAYDTCSNNHSDTILFHTAIQLKGLAQNTQTTLSWNAYVGFGNITKYYIQKFLAGSWQTTDSVNGSATSYIDLNLPCAQLQQYRILANDTNHVYYTLSDTLNLTPFDTVKPLAPIIRAVSVVNNTSVSISFSKVAAQDVNRYQIWAATNNGSFSLLTTIFYPATNPVIYTQTGLNTLSNNYRYFVLAIDSCNNNISQPSVIHKTINLQSIGGAMTNFLYWNKYEGWSAVAGYHILRFNGTTWNLVKTLTGADTSWADTTALKCNQWNSYKVYGFNALNDTSYSDTTVVTPYDTITPLAPIIRAVSVVNNTSVSISFSKVAAQDVNRYQIWAATNNGSFSLLTTIFYPATNPVIYTQTGLNTLSNNYRYYVLAIDSCSNNISQPSVIHKTINLQSIGGAMTNFLYWNKYEGWSAVTGYHILRFNGTTWNLVKTLTGADTSWADTTALKCNQWNSYKVYGFNALNDTSYSDTTVVTPYDTITPLAPIIRAVSVVNNTSVSISFSKVAAQDVNRYQIWAATNNGSFSLLTTIFYPATNPVIYTQTGLNTLSNNYRYYVLAIDSCSNNISQPSVIHKTINLQSIGGAMTNFLYWNKYEGWSAVTGYHILRFNGTTWNLVKTLTGADTSWADTTALKCNQWNSYKVYGFNALNDTSYSDTTVVTPYDTIKPQPPRLRFVTVTSPTSIRVVFDSVMDKDVNRYQLFESVNGGAFTLISTLSAYTSNPIIYDRTGITPMVDHYYYYLVAVDSCANNISANGPIHAEVEIQGVAGNMRSILKWHPYLGFASKIYNVQRLIGGIWTTIGTVNNNDTNYVDLVNISCNINYYYRIQTVDLSAKGYVSLSDTLQVIPFDTVKPIAPLLKYVTVTSSNSVKVKWNLSSSGDVKFYEVHRISPLGVDSYVGTAIFTDTLIDNVVPAQQNSYCYYVIAIDSCNVANRSAPSNTLCTISIQVLLTPGCVPLSHINWTTCKSFDQLPIPNYEIWRTVNGGVWSKLKTVPATDTSYADSTVLLANVYCYVVRAFNASLTFATLSDTECVSPWLFPLQKAPELDVATVLKSGITNGQTVLRWKAIPISDTLTRGYRIYHSSTGVAGTFTLMADIGNRATTTFTQVNVNNYSSDNYYFMVAYDICNYNGDSSVVHKTVNISLARGNLSATISWNKYRGYNVKEYEILKSTNGITYSLLAITDSLTLTYRDTILSCGNRYWYRVKALENLGDNEISFSDVDSIIAYDSIPPPAIIIKQATVSGVGKVAGEISITYNASTELNRNGYKIYRSVNSAPYKLIGTNTNTSAGLLLYKDAGLNTLDSSYSYYIKVTDSCGNEGAASDIHTVVNVSAAAYNSANFVSWTAYVGFTNWHYEVERSSSVNPVWVSIGTFNHYILSIYDSATVCDVMYYYRVKTFDDLDVTASSISDTAGCLGFETNAPDSPVLLRATVNKSGKTTGEIQLDWKHSTSLDATNYLIYRRSNASIAWTFVTQTGYVNTYLDVNLNTTDSVYEYQMECLDNCRNIGAPNASHATINLSTVPGNTSAFLSWTKYIGFPVSRYEVYADGVLIASVPATQLNYQDSMLSCDTAVVYRIKALELNGNLQVSYSDTSSATPYDIIPPNPAYIIAVSVEQPENLVKVKWESIQEFNGKNVDLYRRKATESIWTKIYTSTSRYDTTYTDKGVNAGDTNIYYKITATDNCNNTSGFSKESKTILLRGTSDKLSHTLHWTNYELWNTGVRHYDIIKAEDNGLPYIVATVKSTDTVYVDNDLTTSIHNYCYHIQAHENPWKYYAVSNSNIVCLTQHPIIWIPTAFSPSTSTNLNDEFKPYGLYFSKYEEKIYNRWGELVFISTTHQPAWDGKFDGRYVPTGTFIYMITVTGYDGIEYKFKGPLNIVE